MTREQKLQDMLAGQQTLAIELVASADAEQIAIITLNRPNKKNAMSFLMMRELIRVAEQLRTVSKVRAIILKGAGDAFCAGIDLTDLNNPRHRFMAGWELIKPWQSLFQKVCLIWQSLPIPVIVAIEGHCLGAGLQLALGGDVRIAHPDSSFAIMEAKWGLVADMGLTQSAYGTVRADVLKSLAMTAEVVGAEQALALGLVTELAEDPVARAMALAEAMASRSPDAVLASKRIVNAMYRPSRRALMLEKHWQLKMMLGRNRTRAVKKARDTAVRFLPRQYD